MRECLFVVKRTYKRRNNNFLNSFPKRTLISLLDTSRVNLYIERDLEFYLTSGVFN